MTLSKLPVVHCSICDEPTSRLNGLCYKCEKAVRKYGKP
jgi:hypothetical protein